MKKIALLILILIVPIIGFSQENSDQRMFFNNIKKHDGKAYECNVMYHGHKTDSFGTRRAVMHVRSCEEDRIRISLIIGEDRSTTWVLTLEDDRMLLKHDLRYADGSEKEINMYGGWTSNTGSPNMQTFTADQFTRDLLEEWGNTTWWITIDETSLTYNLSRLGVQWIITLSSDLTKEVETPLAPWGWED